MRKIEGQDTASIHYEDCPGKRTFAVAGVYGGPNPQGTSVVAHLYAEWGMVPSIVEVPVDEHGRGDTSKESVIKRGDINREIQATLVIPPEVALSIGGFLIEKAKKALEIRATVEIIEDGGSDAGS
ncbi:MAG: hypothetical protein QGM45_11735 [Anaerolineales bacterium]|nr:hypothetical protein [Anaerolineales bacterium]